jgi:hypothetical protein
LEWVIPPGPWKISGGKTLVACGEAFVQGMLNRTQEKLEFVGSADRSTPLPGDPDAQKMGVLV